MMRKICLFLGAVFIGFWVIVAIDLTLTAALVFAPWLIAVFSIIFGAYMMWACTRPKDKRKK